MWQSWKILSFVPEWLPSSSKIDITLNQPPSIFPSVGIDCESACDVLWGHSKLDAVPVFFFFFYWLYNPRWVLVCSTILFHSCLSSTFALQPTIFILFRSSSTWYIHLNLVLPAGLVLCGIHSVIFLVVLVFSILITWAAHLSLCDFINLIISSCFILCLSSSFVLILHVPSGFCVGP